MKAIKNYTSISVGPEFHARAVKMADAQGMGVRLFFERTIEWLDGLSKTERAVVMAQVDPDDAVNVLLVAERRKRRELGEAAVEAVAAEVRGAATAKKAAPQQNPDRHRKSG